MDLESLKIEKRAWGENKGKYTGSINFYNQQGSIGLNLEPEQINKIFAICADVLIQTSKEVANDMTANIIEAKAKVLECDNTD